MHKKTLVSIVALLVLILLVSAGCNNDQSSKVDIKLAPLSDMPNKVRQASSSVQKAYQFNIANPEIMQEIPCY